MMSFYDLDHGGSLSYDEFMKFILPCDDQNLRGDACARKTYPIDIKHGKRLYPTVEKTMADYFEREINLHIKLEMMKNALLKIPDWNFRGAFNLIDVQREGEINHFNLFAFCNKNGYKASDDDLLAIIRRLDGGEGVNFDQFHKVLTPIVI